MSVPNTKAKSKPDLTPRIQKLEEDLKLNQSEIKGLRSKIQQKQEENSRLEAEAAKRAKVQIGGGLNWWLNKSLALKINFDHTISRGGAADGGDRAPENVLTVITDIHF